MCIRDRLEARQQNAQARLELVSESNSKQASLRQQATAVLEAQLVELTQQLGASDQSRTQLEHKLELQRSSSKAEVEQAQVDWVSCTQNHGLIIQGPLQDALSDIACCTQNLMPPHGLVPQPRQECEFMPAILGVILGQSQSI